jgi:PAS domain S-box-containing protein/putative nucleotidyltransferase with HDIG domain
MDAAAESFRLLLVEDSQDDALLMIRALENEGLAPIVSRVESLGELRAALGNGSWDMVISDFNLPGFDGLSALEEVNRLQLDVPFILVSGAISDQVAVTAMRSGAQDYVMKDNLARLAPAVRRELGEVEVRRAHRRAEESYRVLVDGSLQGLLVIQGSRIVFANSAAGEIFGEPLEAVPELTVADILEIVEPDHRSRLESQWIHPVASLSDDARSEVRLSRPDGTTRWVQVASQATIVGGTPAVQVAVVDVTRQREREREIEAIAVLATALRAATSRTELVSLLLNQTLELMAADGTALAIRDADGREIRIELGQGFWTHTTGARVDTDLSLTGEVFATGELLVAATADVTDRLACPGVDDGVDYLAGAPLIADETVVGVLWIGRSSRIQDDDRRVLRAIADMAASALGRITLHEETQLRMRRLHALRSIDLAITTSRDLDPVFDVLIEQVLAQLHVAAVCISRIEGASGTLRIAAVHGLDLPVGHESQCVGLAQQVVEGQSMVEVTCLAELEDPTAREELLASLGMVGYVGVPLVASGETCGVIELMHCDRMVMNSERLGFVESIAWQASIAMDNARLVDELRHSNVELADAYESTLEGWARALELRDQETEGHTRRVAELTVDLARSFGVEANDLVHLRRGALLHDIGKMAIPDSILLKPASLDEREWEIMRRHPKHALDMLSAIPHLHPALVIPYGHHERWDGSGYPLGLTGEAIPLPARLFAVVDVWDALMSDRPYRKAWTADEAATYLRANAGVQFDPAIVEVFLDMVT